MKRFAVAACAASCFFTASAVQAADLPTHKDAPIPAAPAPIWTGFYVGVNMGYGWNTNNAANSVASSIDTWAAANQDLSLGSYQTFGALALANSGLANAGGSGFVAGGQVGYNYQWRDRFVVGLEADMQGSAIRGSGRAVGGGTDYFFQDFRVPEASEARLVSGGVSVSSGLDWIGTVRGRVGYLVTPTLLAYATGGFAYGNVWSNVNASSIAQNVALKDNVVPPAGGLYGVQFGAGHANQSKVNVGWTVGGGLEWMFLEKWSVKLEGLYYDLGSSNSTTVTFAPGLPTGGALLPVAFPGYSNVINTRFNYQGAIARAGLNFHF